MSEYLLGQQEREWRRLEEQHALWKDSLMETFDQVGLRAGQSVLDAGCGIGVLLVDLMERVGATGRVVSIERDPSAASEARRRAPGAQVLTQNLEALEVEGPFDLVVSRWVFSFLPDPLRVLKNLVAVLRTGGRLVIQDYNHDGVRLFPDSPAFARAVEGLRASYHDRGGDLWIAGRLPGLYAEVGLELETVTPEVKAGPPGSEAFEWVGRFFHEHVDTIVEAGRLTTKEADAFRTEWQDRRGDPATVLFTPMNVTVVGRKLSARYPVAR